MPPDNGPTWVDYGNLFVNIYQVGQLSAANAKLQQLAVIEATREERARLENDLRQVVFDLEEGLDRVSAYKAKTPLGVLSVIQLMKRIVEGSGIQPATFSQFVDKDRIKSFLRKMNELEQSCRSSLTQSEAEEAARYLPRVPYRDELRRLIMSLEATKYLAKTEERWKALKTEVDARSAVWLVVIVALLLLGFLSVYLSPMVLLYSLTSTLVKDGAAPVAGMFLGCVTVTANVGGVAFLIFAFRRRAQSFTPEYRKLQSDRTAWNNNLLTAADAARIQSLFPGENDIPGYMKWYESIPEFLVKAFERDREGGRLPQSLISLAFPGNFPPPAPGNS